MVMLFQTGRQHSLDNRRDSGSVELNYRTFIGGTFVGNFGPQARSVLILDGVLKVCLVNLVLVAYVVWCFMEALFTPHSFRGCSRSLFRSQCLVPLT